MQRAILAAREAGDALTDNSTMSKLLIALLALVLIGLLATITLLCMRHFRSEAERKSSLPTHEPRPWSARSQHRRLATRPESNYVLQEKRLLMEESDAPRPQSPVPEIRLTFPEELDNSGRPQSARVVVVHVGEQSVGYAPYTESLPTYQENESDRFQSLDLDRIGGLKEKEYR